MLNDFNISGTFFWSVTSHLSSKGYQQTSDGCRKDRATFLAELNIEDYFQEEDEETQGKGHGGKNEDGSSPTENRLTPSRVPRHTVL